MGRISQADGTYKGGEETYNETYTFDNDNRILEKTFSSGMKYSFNYESTDHAIRSIDISGSKDGETRVDFNYNDFGNMTKKTLTKDKCTSITEFKYDETNKLVEIDLPNSNKKLEFKYDNGGQRIVKEFKDNVGVINKNIYVNGFYEIVNDAINKHISDGQYIFATKLDNNDDNLIYYSSNNIGSTTLLTNKNGSDIGEFLYSPFGEMWVEEASTVDISNITRFFTNQQYDRESGLYYYNARYYDPHLGSFITPDPAMESLNHYAYASANPIKYTDPTGLGIKDTTMSDDDYDDLENNNNNNNTTNNNSSDNDYNNVIVDQKGNPVFNSISLFNAGNSIGNKPNPNNPFSPITSNTGDGNNKNNNNISTLLACMGVGTLVLPSPELLGIGAGAVSLSGLGLGAGLLGMGIGGIFAGVLVYSVCLSPYEPLPIGIDGDVNSDAYDPYVRMGVNIPGEPRPGHIRGKIKEELNKSIPKRGGNFDPQLPDPNKSNKPKHPFWDWVLKAGKALLP